jgi:PPOX class probable F420-dependent enzyme
MNLPETHLDLFDKKALAYLATIMKDGSPQVTPVWIDYDGEFVLVNSSRGRQKDLNMRRDGRVAITIQDPDNFYRYLLIRGHVVEITEIGAIEHIHKLSNKYLGKPFTFSSEDEIRVIYKIQPRNINC